jgi:hypothetical protein
MKAFDEGIKASVYLMPMTKVVELTCGLSFVTGKFVPLAAILIAPVIVNILFVNVFLSPAGVPLGVFLVLANGFVALYHKDRYKPLFQH